MQSSSPANSSIRLFRGCQLLLEDLFVKSWAEFDLRIQEKNVQVTILFPAKLGNESPTRAGTHASRGHCRLELTSLPRLMNPSLLGDTKNSPSMRAIDGAGETEGYS